MNRVEAAQDRHDISRFMVHLTRDDRNTFFENGRPARDNFLSILDSQQITAFGSHCLHRPKIPDFHQKKFWVTCFSETPLDQVQHLVGFIRGRHIALDSYGFIFRREFLIANNAQPVTYVSSYGEDQSRRQGYDAIFESALAMKFTGSRWKVLPFVSAMHEKYDFTWEREWRILGSLSFQISDIACAIVPEDVDLEIKKRLASLAIPMFSPDWGLERMVEESGNQQRRVKRLASPPKMVAKRISG
jgi:hypothetical protein